MHALILQVSLLQAMLLISNVTNNFLQKGHPESAIQTLLQFNEHILPYHDKVIAQGWVSYTSGAGDGSGDSGGGNNTYNNDNSSDCSDSRAAGTTVAASAETTVAAATAVIAVITVATVIAVTVNGIIAPITTLATIKTICIYR